MIISSSFFKSSDTYLNEFQFAEAILAQATPRQLRLLGDHVPSNYD